MEPVNYIDSSTYTVLPQSKLIMTALLMWVLDGTAQNLTQWLHRAFAVKAYHDSSADVGDGWHRAESDAVVHPLHHLFGHTALQAYSVALVIPAARSSPR